MTDSDNAPDAAELETRMRATNLHTWLELEALKLGRADQRERHAAGVLPEEELLALARGVLYAPLDGWTRWKNRDLHAREVRHKGSCESRHNDVEYKTLGGAELPAMDADTWNRLGELRHAVNRINVHPWLVKSHASATVEVTKHEARCVKCRAVAVRYTARVALPWAGRILVREYLLSDPTGTVRP